ncbi:MAG: ABC transporter [Chlorobiaceae bacterium]|nr:ABC transporter [Chlorobiaceae bacterium]
MNSLSIKNLTKHYGKIRALHNVSFTVDEGEVFGYLGPNGAGKTTTLRIILGLVYSSTGSVQILGNSPSSVSARTDIGYLPGEFHLYADMSGQALLDYFAGYRLQRPPVLREHLLKALSVQQSDLKRKVKFLSHGTKQKLGLIIAMQHDPKLLLLDEPTTGLDPLVQKSFREIILDRACNGRTVFFSSHVLSEVEAVCSRVAILRAGELVAVESIENLRSKMVRRLQVRFHGSVPHNLAGVPGVTRSQIIGNEVTLWIRGNVNPILRTIAQTEVESFIFPEPELEDVFLTYYKIEG